MKETTLADLAQFKATIEHPEFSHTRTREWCGVECVSAYNYEKDSPSGVFYSGGINIDEENAEVVKELIKRGYELAWARQEQRRQETLHR